MSNKLSDKDILMLIEQGYTDTKIRKEYCIDNKRTKSIRELYLINEGWYIDINTNKVVFTSKKITFDEQLFHFLFKNLILYDKPTETMLQQDKNLLIKSRKPITRLACYLSVKLSKDYETLVRNCRNWSKKEVKLVGYNINKKTIKIDFYDFALDFIQNESFYMSTKSYYYDEITGYPRGYKLWYIYLTPCFMKYVAPVAWESVKSNNIKSKFISEYTNNHKNDKFAYIKSLVGFQLGRWIKHKLNQNIQKEDIQFLIEEYINLSKTIYKGIELQTIFYCELGAYYSGILTNDMKNKVKELLF